MATYTGDYTVGFDNDYTVVADGDVPDAASVNITQEQLADNVAYWGAVVEGLLPTFPLSWYLNSGCAGHVKNGGLVEFELGATGRWLNGSSANWNLGASILWAKGSLPVIQTVVDLNATTGGPAGVEVSEAAYIAIKGPSVPFGPKGLLALEDGCTATNDTDFTNTKTFTNTGPSSGFIDTQITGIDLDHTYVVGASWADKIHISSVTGTRKYAFSHTNAVAGRKVLVTFGDIAGAGGTALELRDGSLVGPVLITLVAVAGYMSAELTFDGSAWYVSQPGVRL